MSWGFTAPASMSAKGRDLAALGIKTGQAESGDGSTDAGGKPFTPLERFVMELFRTITPNGGSISPLAEVRTPPYERHGYPTRDNQLRSGAALPGTKWACAKYPAPMGTGKKCICGPC